MKREAGTELERLTRENAKLRALLKEADEVAWPEVAILTLHPTPKRRELAKERLYAWRDKARAALDTPGEGEG